MLFEGFTQIDDTVQPAIGGQDFDLVESHAQLFEPDDSAKRDDLLRAIVAITVVSAGGCRAEQANAVVMTQCLGGEPVAAGHLSNSKHEPLLLAAWTQR